jgi:hypothetical protein
MDETILNKVAESGIIQIDLTEFLLEEQCDSFDLKETLFMGQILKEKDFRNFIDSFHWEKFTKKNIAVHCSEDVIIQNWAFMLIAAKLHGHAIRYYFCKPNELPEKIILDKIEKLNNKVYENARVVIKGCGEYSFSGEVYLRITEKLMPVCKSIMFGEPCSTVPVFKMKN